VCALEIGAVDDRAERPILRILHAKGGKARSVPMPASTQAAIHEYLRERDALAADDERFRATRTAPMFVRVGDGRPLDPAALDYLVRAIADDAGFDLPDGAAAHAFRHFYGAELALRGVPLALIQQLFGHADPRTTVIYTEVSAQQLIAALDDAGML
jgi:site-specific recombinase XerD